MKKIFLLILVCVGANAHAQYFQRYFNEIVTAPPPAEAFSDGLRSRVNYAGGNPAQYYFVGIGYSELSPPPTTGTDARLRFIRTNRSGAVVNVDIPIRRCITIMVLNHGAKISVKWITEWGQAATLLWVK